MKNLSPALLSVFTVLTAIMILAFKVESLKKIKTISGKEISVSEMDEFISEQMASAGMPGLSIAVINDAEIVYYRTVGVVNANTGEEVSAETVFDAGSMSKPAFTYLVMKMSDQGLLDIDQPLYTYLPYPDIEHDERYKLITTRMVLCHTSGFPNWRFLNSDGKLDIKFTPGTQFLYSGEGFEYLANVIAHIKGIPKNDLQYLFEEEVSRPLGIKYAYFTWNDYVAEHQAAGHVEGKVSGGWGINAGKPDFAAAYSLQTEAISYAKLIIAIMQEQGLRKETIDEMLKPRIQIPSDTFNSSYCLGIRMMSTKVGNLYFHDGYNLNFYSAFMFNKDSKSGYVFFTNCNSGSGFNEKLEAFMTSGI
jgi:CubicO group peptidase (beta-lactamase class C family)